ARGLSSPTRHSTAARIGIVRAGCLPGPSFWQRKVHSFFAEGWADVWGPGPAHTLFFPSSPNPHSRKANLRLVCLGQNSGLRCGSIQRPWSRSVPCYSVAWLALVVGRLELHTSLP